MRLPNTEWLTEEAVAELLDSLRSKHSDEPIYIINPNPIDYVLQLEAISNFFDDDLLLLGSTVIRSIILCKTAINVSE